MATSDGLQPKSDGLELVASCDHTIAYHGTVEKPIAQLMSGCILPCPIGSVVFNGVKRVSAWFEYVY